MSVLVKGMDMPESGTYEVSIDSTNGKDKTVMSLFVREEGGLICCGVYELVPVPPHGRLIDADALMQQIEHDTPLSAVYEKTMRRYLHNASTIIEEGE